ncbi:MAG: nucleolar RNA-binding Nop10p family protein [archaeon]
MSEKKSNKHYKILKCEKGHYTISDPCASCGAKVFNPEPPKYSSTDKYGKQRRKAIYGA